MKLNDKNFCILWGEALASTSKERFVAEWSTSTIFPEDADLLDNATYLDNLWDAAHMSIKEICQAAELTQTAFAIRFCIPLSTVWDWCRGARTPTNYFRLAIIEALGIFQR